MNDENYTNGQICLHINKCEQSTNICTNTSYVYEFTGCVLTFYDLTMGNWNDKNYKSMLKKVN